MVFSSFKTSILLSITCLLVDVVFGEFAFLWEKAEGKQTPGNRLSTVDNLVTNYYLLQSILKSLAISKSPNW